MDGRQDLVDGRWDLVDGWQDLVDGRQDLVDGRWDLVDRNRDFVDVKAEMLLYDPKGELPSNGNGGLSKLFTTSLTVREFSHLKTFYKIINDKTN